MQSWFALDFASTNFHVPPSFCARNIRDDNGNEFFTSVDELFSAFYAPFHSRHFCFSCHIWSLITDHIFFPLASHFLSDGVL
jgi:hypothetical protein